MLALGVVASVIGTLLALAVDWFPEQASSQAKEIDDLYDLLLIASVPIFVLVQAVVLYCVWKFRQRPGDELKDGPPIHGNTRVEVVWTVLPALLLFGLCTYAYIVLEDIERKPSPNEMVVKVTGEQFTWTFEYPAGGQGKAVRSNQLYVPQGQPVEFQIRSKDVIHDFWVPQFRMKIDAVPGITTKYRVTPTRAGRYDVVCAELCGLGHATMRQTAHVLTRPRFDRWMADQKAAAARQS